MASVEHYAGMRGPRSVQISVDLDDGREAVLQRLANQLPNLTSGDDPEDRLNKLLVGLATAGLEEYVEYLSSERHPGTLAQQRELRLSLLIAQLFGQTLPSESLVAEMLGLTPSEARSLVPKVFARYRKRLAGTLEESAKKALNAAKGPLPEHPKWYIVCDPLTYRFLRERLAEIVDSGKVSPAVEGGLLTPMTPDRGTVHGYKVEHDTFNALNESLNLPKRDEKPKK